MLNKAIEFPNPILTVPCAKVEKFDQSLRDLVEHMYKVMKAENFAGLAANQIGVSLRVITLYDNFHNPFVMVNPEVVYSEGEAIMWEGCGSFPPSIAKLYFPPEAKIRDFGTFLAIQTKRPSSILVKYLTETGEEKKMRIHHSAGQLCQATQHEIDHIDGIVFTSRIA